MTWYIQDQNCSKILLMFFYASDVILLLLLVIFPKVGLAEEDKPHHCILYQNVETKEDQIFFNFSSLSLVTSLLPCFASPDFAHLVFVRKFFLTTKKSDQFFQRPQIISCSTNNFKLVQNHRKNSSFTAQKKSARLPNCPN